MSEDRIDWMPRHALEAEVTKLRKRVVELDADRTALLAGLGAANARIVELESSKGENA